MRAADLVLQGFAVNGLVKSKPELGNAAKRKQRCKFRHHQRQWGQQVNGRAQVATPFFLGDTAIGIDDERGVLIGACFLLLRQCQKQVAVDHRAIGGSLVVDIDLWVPYPAGGKPGML
ncbi:hypothetical protein D9M71_118720 [compost metagenome]